MASDKAHSQLVMKLKNELLLTTLTLLLGSFVDGVHSRKCGSILLSPHSCAVTSYSSAPVVTAVPFLTAAYSKFGPLIEAAAVDKTGNLYATDFYSLTSTLGQMSTMNSYQQVFYNATSTSGTNYPFFNGLRFLPTKSNGYGVQTRALAADVNDHSVTLLDTNGAGIVSSSVFCHDPNMVQPNDIAIAPRAGRVYTSGQAWNSDTVVGDGDLWMCSGGPVFSNTHEVQAVRLAVFGRTNGIEVSPDEMTLYLSEAFNRQGSVVANRLWRFSIDERSGYVYNKTLFVDFQQLDGSGSVDIDGMRTDVDGNLFVTRNGGGEVIKFAPDGEVLLRIQVPSSKSPTNLDLGGVDGTSLFVVGKCDAQDGAGCVDVWHGNPVPGRAFRDLNSQ
ncbi:unnamed protein product [Calypogeia fissa]